MKSIPNYDQEKEIKVKFIACPCKLWISSSKSSRRATIIATTIQGVIWQGASLKAVTTSHRWQLGRYRKANETTPLSIPLSFTLKRNRNRVPNLWSYCSVKAWYLATMVFQSDSRLLMSTERAMASQFLSFPQNLVYKVSNTSSTRPSPSIVSHWMSLNASRRIWKCWLTYHCQLLMTSWNVLCQSLWTPWRHLRVLKGRCLQ